MRRLDSLIVRVADEVRVPAGSDEIPPAGRHAALFAITLEPLSGSDAPTSSVIIKGASA